MEKGQARSELPWEPLKKLWNAWGVFWPDL